MMHLLKAKADRMLPSLGGAKNAPGLSPALACRGRPFSGRIPLVPALASPLKRLTGNPVKHSAPPFKGMLTRKIHIQHPPRASTHFGNPLGITSKIDKYFSKYFCATR